MKNIRKASKDVKENSGEFGKRQLRNNNLMVDVFGMGLEMLLPQGMVGQHYLLYFTKGWSSIILQKKIKKEALKYFSLAFGESQQLLSWLIPL